MLTMLSEVRVPFNVVDLFLNPGALSIEGEAAFYFFSPVLLGSIIGFCLVGCTYKCLGNSCHGLRHSLDFYSHIPICVT